VIASNSNTPIIRTHFMAPQVFEFSRFYCMLFTMVSFLVWLVCGWHADKPALLVHVFVLTFQTIDKQSLNKP